MDPNKDLIGQGWAFPLRLNTRNAISLVTGNSEIEQSIWIILGTIPGERVMRPEFGCRAWELVFAPNNAATQALLEYYVRQALEFWEPRIALQRVAVDTPPGQESTLAVTIDYVIKATHDPRSIVYPFYIMGEGA